MPDPDEKEVEPENETEDSQGLENWENEGGATQTDGAEDD